MRYLGNKTRLLDSITDAARRIGFEGGTVCDLFAGSGVVSRHFRSLGHRVLSADLMESSHVFQRVFLELEEAPAFRKLDPSSLLADSYLLRETPPLEGDWGPTLAVLAHLEALPPAAGLLTTEYSPAGISGRGYFSPEVAGQLDAAIQQLREWRAEALIEELEECLLLAMIIDAADRKANISGTYGAFLKQWQPNSRGAVEYRLPRIENGPRGEAYHGDATDWISSVSAELLYLDPPYNNRQYASNYHLFEVICRLVREPDLEAFRSTIYGKTGLIPWGDKASKLCRKRECFESFRKVLSETQIPRLVISYNEEGILKEDDFRRLLSEYAGSQALELDSVLTRIAYPRFRSDRDGREARNGSVRRYTQVEGREPDQVHEWLYHVERR